MSVGPIIDVDAWNPAHGVCNQRKLVQEACVASCLLKRACPYSSYVQLLLAVTEGNKLMTKLLSKASCVM